MYIVKCSALVHMAETHSHSCVLRHMNSCRIFPNIHSITYKYVTKVSKKIIFETGEIMREHIFKAI